jgi:hypothetical protein
MKLAAWIILGVAALAAAGFAALWIWGTLAFTPPRVISAIVGQGELGDGVIYEIVRGGSPLAPAGHSVTLGTHELGLRYTCVGFDAAAPRPLSATRAAPDRVDVLLDRPLKDGARMVSVPLGSDLVPTEIVTVTSDGEVARMRAPWLMEPGEAPL